MRSSFLLSGVCVCWFFVSLLGRNLCASCIMECIVVQVLGIFFKLLDYCVLWCFCVGNGLFVLQILWYLDGHV